LIDPFEQCYPNNPVNCAGVGKLSMVFFGLDCDVEESGNLADCKGGCENMRLVIKVKISFDLVRKAVLFIY
jgi:hypothetical protein